MKEVLEVAGRVAGIGGLAIAAFVIVTKAVIGKTAKVGQRHSYALLNLTLWLSGAVAVLGIIAWIIGTRWHE